MSMLKPATNKVAYAKIGIYGDAGSGKTFTAAQFAIGLHQYGKLDKPVAMFDTEPAASYIIPLFQEAGIDFLVYDESRALADLMAFMDEAEQAASIIIVDSVTHIWRDVQESFLAKVNERRAQQRRSKLFQLEFQHWREIKGAWGKFTDRFLSSKVHMIVCGRAGSIYTWQEGANGKKELITDGTKMATEKEMAYEPSLLIEMVKHREGGRIINRALIEKDRSNQMNGMEFDYPTFKDIKPHVDFLNIGGDHFASMEERNSTGMFDGDEGGSGWDKERRQRDIESEELQGLFVKYGLAGQAKDEKERRLELLEEIFGTRSWTAICGLDSETLRAGCDILRAKFQPPAVAVPDEGTIPEEDAFDTAANQ